jgi:hypothetical protein
VTLRPKRILSRTGYHIKHYVSATTLIGIPTALSDTTVPSMKKKNKSGRFKRKPKMRNGGESVPPYIAKFGNTGGMPSSLVLEEDRTSEVSIGHTSMFFPAASTSYLLASSVSSATGQFKLFKAAKSQGGDRYKGDLLQSGSGNKYFMDLYIPQSISRRLLGCASGRPAGLVVVTVSDCKTPSSGDASSVRLMLVKKAKSGGGDRYEGTAPGGDKMRMYIPQGITRPNTATYMRQEVYLSIKGVSGIDSLNGSAEVSLNPAAIGHSIGGNSVNAKVAKVSRSGLSSGASSSSLVCNGSVAPVRPIRRESSRIVESSSEEEEDEWISSKISKRSRRIDHNCNRKRSRVIGSESEDSDNGAIYANKKVRLRCQSESRISKNNSNSYSNSTSNLPKRKRPNMLLSDDSSDETEIIRGGSSSSSSSSNIPTFVDLSQPSIDEEDEGICDKRELVADTISNDMSSNITTTTSATTSNSSSSSSSSSNSSSEPASVQVCDPPQTDESDLVFLIV